MFKSLKFLAAVVALAGLAAPAAAVTVYTDEAAFQAAASGLTSYGFPDYGEQTESVGPAYLNGPAGFFGNTPALAVFNDGTYGEGQTYLGSPDGLNVLIGSGTAIGFHIATYAASGTIDLTYNGEYITSFDTLDSQTPVFIGLTDLDFFSLITFDYYNVFGSDSELDLIDFSTDAAAFGTVPEPATWALLIIGFGAVGTAARRRRNLAAA